MSDHAPYLGFCTICKTGTLGVRICGACEQPTVMCDECEALWRTAPVAGEPMIPEQPEIPCPHCDASLLCDTASWADGERLQQIGWDKYIVGTGSMLGETDGEKPLD